MLFSLGEHLKEGHEVNKRLLNRIEKLELDKEINSKKNISSTTAGEQKEKELNLIEKALGSRLKESSMANNSTGLVQEKKNNYGILT